MIPDGIELVIRFTIMPLHVKDGLWHMPLPIDKVALTHTRTRLEGTLLVDATGCQPSDTTRSIALTRRHPTPGHALAEREQPVIV